IIAITDHLEYQPKKEDIPNPDLNRSYVIAKKSVDEKDLIILKGSEITRHMPPGHFNAIFINDANKLLIKGDSLAGIIEANNQGAFVFWNHPHWTSKSEGRMDGIAKLDPVHEELISNNLVHGLEVANEDTYSEEALEIAINNNLTVLGNSDIHGLIDWDFDIPNGGHRPLTFVITKDNSQNSIKESLFKGHTFVWFKDLLIGKEENIKPIIESNIKFKSNGYIGETTVLELEVSNLSSVPISLEYQGEYTFHKNSKFLKILPNSSFKIQIKTISKVETISLPFNILNVVTGLRKSLSLDFDLKIQ
ncbi:MAG: PHP domain-containing protein, partial [Cryomorphaceae bacterium]|nr:PHP domain-containing protein [Cryomorphaceae bacterium]